jgi:hypothetical protein
LVHRRRTPEPWRQPRGPRRLLCLESSMTFDPPQVVRFAIQTCDLRAPLLHTPSFPDPLWGRLDRTQGDGLNWVERRPSGLAWGSGTRSMFKDVTLLRDVSSTSALSAFRSQSRRPCGGHGAMIARCSSRTRSEPSRSRLSARKSATTPHSRGCVRRVGSRPPSSF